MQVKELNKTRQDLKMEVETSKKSQREKTGDRKPWKEIRSHRCKHQQKNKRDRRKSLWC